MIFEDRYENGLLDGFHRVNDYASKDSVMWCARFLFSACTSVVGDDFFVYKEKEG